MKRNLLQQHDADDGVAAVAKAGEDNSEKKEGSDDDTTMLSETAVHRGTRYGSLPNFPPVVVQGHARRALLLFVHRRHHLLPQ